MGITSFREAAFGDNLEGLRKADIPVPEYMPK